MRSLPRLTLLLLLLVIGCGERQGPTDSQPAPGAYYMEIDFDLTSEALKSQLHELINDHQPLTYSELWDALISTDADPDNPGHVHLFYTGWSRSADMHGNDPSGWNREHLWAKSRGGFGNRLGAGTDLHAIRPTDVTVNTARGTKAFDAGGELYIDGDGPTRCRSDADSWEPRPEIRGDVARALFYMAVRYEEDDLDLELTEDARGQSDKVPIHGVLSTLLRWHEQDPPDDAERIRNDRVEALQGNRNPFVDHPEFVDAIWGTP